MIVTYRKFYCTIITIMMIMIIILVLNHDHNHYKKSNNNSIMPIFEKEIVKVNLKPPGNHNNFYQRS